MLESKTIHLLLCVAALSVPGCTPEPTVRPLIDRRMPVFERFGINSKEELRAVLLKKMTWDQRNFMWIVTWLHDTPTEVEIALELIQKDPNDFEAYATAANALIAVEDYKRALAILDEAARHKLVVRDFRTGNKEAWNLDDYRSSALLALGRYDETVQAQKKVGDRDGARGHRIAAQALLLAGRYEEALVEARRAVALGPDEAYSRWFLAMALTARLEVAKARRATERAMELDPTLTPAYLALQNPAASLDEMLEWSQKHFDLVNRQRLLRCGHYYLDLDLPGPAGRCFEAADTLDPGISLHMPILHTAEKDPTRAWAMAQVALQESRHPHLLNAAGWVAFLAGSPEKARPLIEEGLESDPVNNTYNLRLATVCEALGDDLCAEKALALTIQPTAEDVGNAVFKFALMLLPLLLAYIIIRGLVIRRMKART